MSRKTVVIELPPPAPCSLCGCLGKHFCTGRPSKGDGVAYVAVRRDPWKTSSRRRETPE